MSTTWMMGLVLGAALCMTGCAADNEPDPNPAPEQSVPKQPLEAIVGIPENQAPQAPPPSQTTGTGGTGAQVSTPPPRITPPPSH